MAKGSAKKPAKAPPTEDPKVQKMLDALDTATKARAVLDLKIAVLQHRLAASMKPIVKLDLDNCGT